MKFLTETGSEYEINADGGEPYIRRLNDQATKRADGEWKRLLVEPRIEVGSRAVLLLESLADYGPDDEGRVGTGSPVTTRTTSRVTEVHRD